MFANSISLNTKRLSQNSYQESVCYTSVALCAIGTSVTLHNLRPLRDSVCLLYKTFSLSLHISKEPKKCANNLRCSMHRRCLCDCQCFDIPPYSPCLRVTFRQSSNLKWQTVSLQIPEVPLSIGVCKLFSYASKPIHALLTSKRCLIDLQ